jgi:pimeloyl-ACP methyl ester carboxylesterase
MAKKSQTVKEVLQVVVFLVVIAVLLIAFVIYPLKQTKAIMGRDNIDDFNPDSLPINDPGPFFDAGLPVDTFHVDIDVLTTLAGVYVAPKLQPGDSIKGTVILLHGQQEKRADMIPLAAAFRDSGYGVVVYDQRGVGYSGGKYRGDGQYESADLLEVISYLVIRDRVARPLAVMGEATGADAAILAAQQEKRIDRVVAIKPYLTTNRMLDRYRDQRDLYWLPFFRSVFWWWYNMRSGYAYGIRSLDDIRAVACPTLILAPEDWFTEPEFEKLKELSEPDRLQLSPLPPSDSLLTNRIIGYIIS